MVKDGYYFSTPLLLAGVILIYLDWMIPGLLFIFLGCFVIFFFRDPERSGPRDPGLILSPADGKIVSIVNQEEGTRVSIFLSVFNVHVVRSPISGQITGSEYRKGKFLLAFDERASLENEQQVFTVEGEQKVTFSLIAGLVARRIIPWKNRGDQISRGDRIALIRFGSRVDILIPAEFDVRVKNRDRVHAGVSVLASFKELK